MNKAATGSQRSSPYDALQEAKFSRDLEQQRVTFRSDNQNSDGLKVNTDNEYRHNHYVPEWYQKRFLLPGKGKYWYLDLKPERQVSNGKTWTRNERMNWGPVRCFAQDDLYTTKWGAIENRDIEKFFFGQIDTQGKAAVEHFAAFEFDENAHDAFHALLPYMSVQKLRTPKGLGFLQELSGNNDQNFTMRLLQEVQHLFCALWTECVWQIADASESPTKFIISDHPVVVYNRECFPSSKYCTGFRDPDIAHVASQTYFPLSLDKILILTNLSWVRDPYQNPLRNRPNPKKFRQAIFNFLDIQIKRKLDEEEVIEINYITKRRALRYIAAAEQDWLYPERRIRSDDWRRLGDGYLLMPDPRHIFGGGEITIGYDNGRSAAFSAYGHRPWEKGYQDKARDEREWENMQRFKAEWSAMIGQKYRGVTYDMDYNGQKEKTSDEFHAHELELDKVYRARPGERQRRRKLKRPPRSGT